MYVAAASPCTSVFHKGFTMSRGYHGDRYVPRVTGTFHGSGGSKHSLGPDRNIILEQIPSYGTAPGRQALAQIRPNIKFGGPIRNQSGPFRDSWVLTEPPQKRSIQSTQLNLVQFNQCNSARFDLAESIQRFQFNQIQFSSLQPLRHNPIQLDSIPTKNTDAVILMQFETIPNS